MGERQRQCGHCGEWKPLFEFGTAPYCRQCMRELHRARRAAQRADMSGSARTKVGPEPLPSVSAPVTERSQALRRP